VVAAQLAGHGQLVVHVGAATLRDCLRLVEHAVKHGAHALGAIPPYYYHYEEEALFQYFRAIIEASPVPVYVYDNPGTTGNPISPELVNRLAAIGLHGVKDSSFDISKTYALMRKITKQGIDVVIGSESLLLPAYVMGAQACIAGLANVLPELLQSLNAAARGTDMQRARELQTRVLKMRDILHYGPSIPTALAMLKLRGFDAGWPRRPMLPLPEETFSKVKHAMEETRSLWSL
jgi:N-acetylneuraminate lyase/4-hydroxy-tetrahydrodipicolinate synthase